MMDMCCTHSESRFTTNQAKKMVEKVLDNLKFPLLYQEKREERKQGIGGGGKHTHSAIEQEEEDRQYLDEDVIPYENDEEQNPESQDLPHRAAASNPRKHYSRSALSFSRLTEGSWDYRSSASVDLSSSSIAWIRE